MNFLHGFFEPKVDCDVVSTDGYSADNLVSSNWRDRNQGFLAAHFVRPPAVLLFELPFPVSVESLVIKPKVGSQISTGIDVFVANVKRKAQSIYPSARLGKEALKSCGRGRNAKRQKLSRRTQKSDIKCTSNQSVEGVVPSTQPILHDYADTISAATFKAEHMELFAQVGRIFGADDGRTISVINPRFQDRSRNVSPSTQLEEFRQAHLLRCVTHLVLRVTRVCGACAAAIGQVELWGKPASTCGQEIIDYACQIQARISSQNRGVSSESYNGNKFVQNGSRTVSGATAQKNNITKNSQESDEATSSIPEEFIDAITCNIMTIPMLLPSGHNIDSTTLDKHSAAEQVWGRMPSDPFTGIPFSAMYKAVPNGALKVRIDKFLLSSGLNVQGLGRTVGRAKEASASIHWQKMKSPKCEGLDSYRDTSITRQCSVERSSHGTRSSQLNQSAENTSQENTEKTSSNQSRIFSHSNEKEPGGWQNHEDIVSQSLDVALKTTLQGLSTFTRKRPRPPQTVVYVSSLVDNQHEKRAPSQKSPSAVESLQSSVKKTTLPRTCVCCQMSLHDQMTFRLPCEHLICRKCITEKSVLPKDRKCSLCGSSFTRTDVIRVHHV